MKNSRLSPTGLQFLECECCLCWCRISCSDRSREGESHVGGVREFSTPLVSPQSPAPPGSIIPDRRIAAPTCPPCPTASAPRWNRLALPLPAQSEGGGRLRIRSWSWRRLRRVWCCPRPLFSPPLPNPLHWTVFPPILTANKGHCF